MSKYPRELKSVLTTVCREYAGDTQISSIELVRYLLCCYFLDAQPTCTFQSERQQLAAYRRMYEKRYPAQTVRIGLQLRLEL